MSNKNSTNIDAFESQEASSQPTQLPQDFLDLFDSHLNLRESNLTDEDLFLPIQRDLHVASQASQYSMQNQYDSSEEMTVESVNAGIVVTVLHHDTSAAGELVMLIEITDGADYTKYEWCTFQLIKSRYPNEVKNYLENLVWTNEQEYTRIIQNYPQVGEINIRY